MQEALIGFAYLLIILGTSFALLSFRRSNRKNSKKKLIRIGGYGVIIALIGGLILICFYYATEPVSERLIEEHLDENYPDRPLDVSMQENLQHKGIA